MRPVEAFDIRGYVGYLSAYITDPTFPALLVQQVGRDPEPWPLSVNLVEHGWEPSGLEIAVKEYEPGHLKVANCLHVNEIFGECKKTIPGPHGPGWRIYPLVRESLKPTALAAWDAWMASRVAAPEGLDVSPENLQRVTAQMTKTYENRLTWPNARPGELRHLLSVWADVARNHYQWARLTDEARQEIVETLEDEG